MNLSIFSKGRKLSKAVWTKSIKWARLRRLVRVRKIHGAMTKDSLWKLRIFLNHSDLRSKLLICKNLLNLWFPWIVSLMNNWLQNLSNANLSLPSCTSTSTLTTLLLPLITKAKSLFLNSTFALNTHNCWLNHAKLLYKKIV